MPLTLVDPLCLIHPTFFKVALLTIIGVREFLIPLVPPFSKGAVILKL